MVAMNELIAMNESSQNFRIQYQNEPHPTVKKLLSFRRLNEGWHYGAGYKINTDTLDQAINFHKYALSIGFYETDAFPIIDGGVVLTVYYGVEYLEFTLTPQGEIEYCRETNDVEVCQETGLTLDRAEEVLRNFRQETCKPFDFYTTTTLITTKNVLFPQHSHPSGLAFLLLMNNAS